MYWDILDDKRKALLKEITERNVLIEYYLAGGTALSLQLGLRKSLVFDFFARREFNPDSLYQKLSALADGPVYAHNIDKSGTCDVIIDDVRVSFFLYPYRMLCDYVKTPEMPGLYMADVRDIAAMKALAIGGRGARKDFFDLYQIFLHTGYTVDTLIRDLYQKYGTDRDFSYIGMGLSYFDDADAEELPQTFADYSWPEIKGFFEELQPEFFAKIKSQNELYII